MNSYEIADLFDRMAALMEIRGDNFHRLNAYRRGAATLRDVGRDMSVMLAEGEDLTKLPGIGKTLAAKVMELVETGELKAYQKLAAEIPPSLVDLTRVEGLGGKRVKQIYDALGITTLEALHAAAASGELAEKVSGMGAKTAERILKNTELLLEHGDDRYPIYDILPLAEQVVAELLQVDAVEKAAFAGSLRRYEETIGDLDMIVGVREDADPDTIIDAFLALALIDNVDVRGSTKVSVYTWMGIQIDLRVLPLQNWGSLLLYFTGNKQHNIELRELAHEKGYSLNEYGLKPVDGGDLLLFDEEEALYRKLDLPYFLPTLRQGKGEIKAAEQGKLPDVIRSDQIVSDLHMHSDWSDGKMTIEQMAEAAKARGLKIIAITDHSHGLAIANGLSIARLREQAQIIHRLNEQYGDELHILHGTEMEIRADATLDFPDDVLAQLDIVVASLHTSLQQPREQIMKRLMTALDNPHVDIIAHPTGRLLGARQGADVDLDQLVMAASSSGTVLEINANPHRLDLCDNHVRRAVAMGCKLAINTDAHHVDNFDLRHYGIAVGQRGWLTARACINTWPYDKLMAYLRRND